MRYISTRGSAPALDFEGVLNAGLARDGGLYVPESWPSMAPEQLARLVGAPYQEAAFAVMQPFVAGSVPDEVLTGAIDEAYAEFRHRCIAPLVQLGPGHWVLELFHGPTLAFKDLAMQVLARLMDWSLSRRSRRATIIGATSGDTGGAAVDAFRGREAIDIFILHPYGRVSDVQRRQMTTAEDANVHNIALEGTFDDCQSIVKGLFNDHAFRDGLALAGVNSINWARIVAQVVYYATAAAALGAPGRRLRFSVPTGNFGDVFAGYVAARMGVPISRLLVATNVNDILARLLASGRYEPRPVVATASPSMDIQLSSNFERLAFDLSDRDGGRVRALFDGLGQEGSFALSERELAAARVMFGARRTDEAATLSTIRAIYEATGYVLDPHTAVGVAAAEAEPSSDGEPIVTLATAHPAKFPDTVREAIGWCPDLPEAVARRIAGEERFTVLPNDQGKVAAFIAERSRAGQGAVA